MPDVDEDANAFLRRSVPTIRRAVALTARRYGSPIESDDLAQEVLLELLRHPDRWRHKDDASLIAYANGIARLKVLNALRRISRLRRVHPILAFDLAIAVEIEDEVEDVKREELRRCVRAVAQLPDAQREVIAMRYFLGRSFEEIAERLGHNNANAAYQLHHRAVSNLKTILGVPDESHMTRNQ